MQNRQRLLFLAISLSSLLFSYEAYAKRGMGGGGHNKTDTTPSQFSFIDQNNVALSSLINSNSIRFKNNSSKVVSFVVSN